jgi:hypothetical protein
MHLPSCPVLPAWSHTACTLSTLLSMSLLAPCSRLSNLFFFFFFACTFPPSLVSIQCRHLPLFRRFFLIKGKQAFAERLEKNCEVHLPAFRLLNGGERGEKVEKRPSMHVIGNLWENTGLINSDKMRTPASSGRNLALD